jgi:hypothetical protein
MDQYSYYLSKPSKIFYINIELAEQHSPVFGVAVAQSPLQNRQNPNAEGRNNRQFPVLSPR